MSNLLEAENQLKKVGFEKLGSSPLYRARDFVVSIRSNGTYQFFSDYPAPYSDPNLEGLIGIKTGTLSHSTTPSLIFVGIDRSLRDYAVEYTTNGSGGGLRGENIPQVGDFAGKEFRQQLMEAGFEPLGAERGVYHILFKQYGNQEVDIYALMAKDSIDRIVRPAESYLSTREKGRHLVEKLGVILEGFAKTRKKGFLDKQESTEPVLRAKNSVFEFEYNRFGNLAVNRILRDLTPEELGVVTPEVVEPSDFKIAGVNSTELIRSLTSINGQPIKSLEQRMRPAIGRDLHGTGGISIAGFLGMNESLLEVMAADNDLVLSQGLTHQDLGRMIKYVQEMHWKLGVSEFTYRGRNFGYSDTQWRGIQESPFNDGTGTNIDIEVRNLNNGSSFNCSGLLGDMVERYGFYEGPASPYRLEPKAIIDTFDFLQKQLWYRVGDSNP